MNHALDSRARFEAHRLEKTGRTPRTWGAGTYSGDEVPARLQGKYVEPIEQAAWEAWQAAIASMAAPEGWVLVPPTPTEEMHIAAVRTIVRCNGNDEFPGRVWRAMLAAAPTPQAPPIAALAAKETPQ